MSQRLILLMISGGVKLIINITKAIMTTTIETIVTKDT